MKRTITIGTFRIRVSSSKDNKTLGDGTKKKYVYGSISTRSPLLADYIGQDVLVRIQKAPPKKGKK